MLASKDGSLKVLAATRRINVENDYLGTLSVQCDDESLIDQVMASDGKLKPFNTVLRVVANNFDAVRFVDQAGTYVVPSLITKSLQVISDCQKTVKKFSNR